ncbi:hypothetical protein [Actinobaculum sp. 352]|nr:hypothetical protein [Actinobaculum sp. 352]
MKLAKSFDGVDRFVIVTHDDERTIEENGVRIDVVPAYKFLLEEDLRG